MANKNRLDYQANLSRHPHDVSAGYSSSIAPSYIVPQYSDIAQPGDAYYFNTRLFCRLQDTVTAFLGEIDVHIDYFFVPLQMLFTPFGQIYAQTDDVLSSLYKNLGAKDTFPVLNIMSSIGGPNHNVPVGDFPSDGMDCFGKNYFRLFDALNLNPLCIFGDPSDEYDSEHPIKLFTGQPNVSPWIPAAYQAIYQKYYRNDELERFKVEDYNFDQYYTGTSFSQASMLKLRRVMRPADYFTTTRVGAITSAVNSLGGESLSSQFGLGDINDPLGKVATWLNDDPASIGDDWAVARDDGGESTSTGPNPFEFTSSFNGLSNLVNAASIRSLFALDKYLRIYGRAGKTYDEQILAHFGVKIPHDVKHDITHIKHYKFSMVSDPIYGTANIQNTQDDERLVSSLGQVGGQCSGAFDNLNEEPDKFVAPVHGVFMAVAYVLTRPRYFGTYSKLHELDSRIKFPIPEFDKLGAQPIYAHECNPAYLNGSGTQTSVRIGWQNRYNEFKHKYNRCSYIYANLQKYFSSASDNYPAHYPEFGDNIYAPWMISRVPFKLRENIGLEDSDFIPRLEFFERPDVLDDVMVNTYKKNWDASYEVNPQLILQSDPILTEFFAKVKKVSWMSPTGEPDL